MTQMARNTRQPITTPAITPGFWPSLLRLIIMSFVQVMGRDHIRAAPYAPPTPPGGSFGGHEDEIEEDEKDIAHNIGSWCG